VAVPVLEAIVLPALEPRLLLGLESYFLETTAAGHSAPILLVHTHPGRALSLGRYHPWSGPAERGGIIAWRRLTGGRVLGSGEGWLAITLVVPRRGALLSERDAAIAPEQVINRYVRGLLSAFKTLGLNAFYPGRDAVTAGGREIALCSFEVDSAGAMLFEAFVAVNRGMEEVVRDLERFDPDGELATRFYGPDSASKLVRELDRDLGFDELAEAIVGGYSASFRETRRRELSGAELAQGEYRGAAMESAGWLNSLVPALECSAVARVNAQLGAIEARLGIAPGGTIERFQLTGDFIANSSALGRLESELRGKPLDFDAISDAVIKTFGNGDNFLLGAGALSELARLITRAR
jgi:lipoate-protein ligase A